MNIQHSCLSFQNDGGPVEDILGRPPEPHSKRVDKGWTKICISYTIEKVTSCAVFATWHTVHTKIIKHFLTDSLQIIQATGHKRNAILTAKQFILCIA